MISDVIDAYQWARRVWPYLTLGALLALAWCVMRSCRGNDGPAYEPAHQATVIAEKLVMLTDTLYVHDTVRVAPARAAYRTARDAVVRTHYTDTALVKVAFATCDSALAVDSAALASAARAIRAHQALESALRTELDAALRLRPKRFSVSSEGGVDTDHRPVTGVEAVVRVSAHWSVVGRVEQRWLPSEPPRRLLLVRYTL